MSTVDVKQRVSWEKKEAAIRSLMKRDGTISPSDLIEAARDPDHPCFNDFTWSIQQAAEERWRDQARALIRRVTVQVEYGTVTAPAVQYVSAGDEEGTFIAVAKVRKGSDVNEMMLREIAQLHGLTSRVLGLAISKQNTLGDAFVQALANVRGQLAGLKEELEE